ncbi:MULTISPECIES: glycosyltransferase family 2 protein [unclassified Microbacterium]|uniref:glycosyltransferase family 2 protein n=1 Tax=unclassified Microbacterium TaxID=2609290 RepID=UPI0012F77362|nr:glycosyltransferase family 2 protein [Microbacterium sp. MAH-37]MVQ41827.1 glycosyltransferase [Microbacterium sp. MAH-37]
MTRTSVIVPCYNAESTAARAIGSVLAQTDPDLEIIAVDDGSSDGTSAVLEGLSDPRLRVVAHEQNRGISEARNTGLRAASGDFIAFLDADDEWEPHFLARMHEVRGDAGGAICGRTVLLPDGTERTAHSRRLGVLSGSEAATDMMTGAVTPFPWDKIIIRAAFAGVAYPADIHRFEDQAVGMVVLSRVEQVVSVPDALVRYHVAAGSLTWGRVPDVAEAEKALAFAETELGDWLDRADRRSAFDTCRTLFLMLTAQSAMRSTDSAARAAVLRECRVRITAGMLAASLRRSPVVGAGALLLKLAPGVYRRLFTVYVRRQYALG